MCSCFAKLKMKSFSFLVGLEVEWKVSPQLMFISQIWNQYWKKKKQKKQLGTFQDTPFVHIPQLPSMQFKCESGAAETMLCVAISHMLHVKVIYCFLLSRKWKSNQVELENWLRSWSQPHMEQTSEAQTNNQRCSCVCVLMMSCSNLGM